MYLIIFIITFAKTLNYMDKKFEILSSDKLRDLIKYMNENKITKDMLASSIIITPSGDYSVVIYGRD